MKPSRLPDISPRDRIGRVWERVMVAGFIVDRRIIYPSTGPWIHRLRWLLRTNGASMCQKPMPWPA